MTILLALLAAGVLTMTIGSRPDHPQVASGRVGLCLREDTDGVYAIAHQIISGSARVGKGDIISG